MPVGVRHLTVLGEFKPFGLIAEALDGGKAPESADDERYQYFLFDPEIARERDSDLAQCSSPGSTSCEGGEHELFIRGNRIIWSMGSQVHRRYTSSSSIVMACWCHMDSISEPLLCVLQTDTLTIYNTSGEVICIPLLHAITSIWPLPFGLLLQRATDVSCPANLPFPSLSPLLNARDLSHPYREYGSTRQYNFSTNSPGHNAVGDVSTMLSHLILKHPLEEPQVRMLSIIEAYIFLCRQSTTWTIQMEVSHYIYFVHLVHRSQNISLIGHALDRANRWANLIKKLF